MARQPRDGEARPARCAAQYFVAQRRCYAQKAGLNGARCCFLDSFRTACHDYFMLAVIGNLLAAVAATTLFASTLRLTKKRT